MANLKLTTSVTAHPDRVWATIGHFEGYPRWHPLVSWVKLHTDWTTKIAARVGIERTVRLRGSLIDHDPSNLFRWDLGHRVWGLIRVRYSVQVVRTSLGSDVVQTVRVGGWLPRLAPRLLSSLPDALAVTAHALKREVERQPAAQPAAA